MAYHTGPKIVTDGLVLCLDAADRKSYPGTGTAWNDLSGNNANATLYNSAIFNGSNNGCISFATSTQDYFLASTSSFNVSSFSISIWFILTTFADQYINLFQHSTNSLNNNRISIERGNSYNGGQQLNSSEIKENSFIVLLGNSSGSLSVAHTQTSFSTGQWYNISICFNGSVLGLYVNGINEFSGNPTYFPSAKHSTFGNYPYGGQSARYLDGKIANFLVYSRALSSDEIRSNYDATKGRFGL